MEFLGRNFSIPIRKLLYAIILNHIKEPKSLNQAHSRRLDLPNPANYPKLMSIENYAAMARTFFKKFFTPKL